VGFTPIRVVCANTLALAHADRAGSKLIRVRHTRRLADNLEALREVLDLADQEFTATAEQYRRLRDLAFRWLSLGLGAAGRPGPACGPPTNSEARESQGKGQFAPLALGVLMEDAD
jgi:hypothetical protein